MKDRRADIRSQLLDGVLWGDRNDLWPSEGLERRLAAADATERAELVAGCMALLDDPEIPVRSGVVAVLPEIAAEVGAEWLLRELSRAPHLYAQVAPEGAALTQPSLDRAIQVAMAQVVQPHHASVIAHLRSAAFSSGWGTWLLPALARVDGEWLIGHARELVPHQMVSVLIPMTPPQRRELIARLAPWPELVIEQIPPAFWAQFELEEAQALQALMRQSR